MNKHSMTFIGLDTHKEFHEVAYCEEQRGATPVHYGRIPSSKVSVKYTNMPVLFSQSYLVMLAYLKQTASKYPLPVWTTDYSLTCKHYDILLS